MDPIKKLLKMMDWQDANRPLKVEEKAELMKLTDIDFEERLHQMAVDFKNDGGDSSMSLRKLKHMTLMLLFIFPLFSIVMIKVSYDQQQKIEELEQRVYSHSRSIGRWAEIVGKMEETNKAQDFMINKFNRELFPEKPTEVEVETNDNY